MKRPRKICITEEDRKLIVELIAVANKSGGRDDLEALAKELARAQIVTAEAMRRDVVTMNSKVVIEDVDSGKEMTYLLVFPKDANVDTGAVSILAPIGTAILGYAEGNEVEWRVPAGIRRFRIKKIVFQPEADKQSRT